MAGIDFWFSIGSTYSYLSVMRLDRVSAESGIGFNWRPFNVRSIMREMENIPFANKPAKAAYMWRDVARRAALHGLSPVLPAPYPLAELELANRVALLGMADGWGKAYVRETYRRWFELGEAAGSEPNISQSIAAAGADPASVLAQASSATAEALLASATAEAKALGVFGSPTFVVDGELFWGDDRLDDAIAWQRGDAPLQRTGLKPA
jgi:2-hydroxychromene-2-carboxylate isomerase